jgi:hypothetical protein
MPFLSPSLPKVSLRRGQWVRLIVVGFFAALAVARVAPDLVRVAVPLSEFDYATDGNGVVVRAGPGIRAGDRIRVDLETFANERLTFAAPVFFDRTVNAIVVYGHSAIGLDLDPDEREGLIEVVAHASIALHAIELVRLRALAGEARSPGAQSLPI